MKLRWTLTLLFFSSLVSISLADMGGDSVADIECRLALDDSYPSVGDIIKLSLDMIHRGPDRNQVKFEVTIPNGYEVVNQGSFTKIGSKYQFTMYFPPRRGLPWGDSRSMLLKVKPPLRGINYIIQAEVIEATATDPDSFPNNGTDAGEDDDSNITIKSFPTYCSISGNDPSSEWIESFLCGNINSYTGRSDLGYSGIFYEEDYIFQRGKAYYFELTPKLISEGRNFVTGYIDYNNDGSFGGPREKFLVKVIETEDAIIGGFIVHEDAEIGVTRLRIAIKHKKEGTPEEEANGIVNPESVISGPCGDFERGEVEDYLIRITDENTYCIPEVNGDTWIQEIETIDKHFKTGDNDGYLDNTANFITLTPGETPLKLTSNLSPPTTAYWSLWIDINRNFIFDPYELIWEGTEMGPIQADVFLNPGVDRGFYRMRISMKLGEKPPFNPCHHFYSGEVEDYTVFVDNDEMFRIDTPDNKPATSSDSRELQHEISENKINIFPNPTSDKVVVEVSNESKLKVVNISGTIVLESMISVGDNSFSIQDWSPGVYIFQIHSGKEKKSKKVIVH